jgi:putative membrane protein
MDKVSPIWWQDSLKGLLIGLGMLAPGLSGGVFAVALGVYPRLIEGITNMWKHPIAVIKDLFWIAVGGLIGLLMTFFIILALIEFAPLPFTLLFLGFIIGSIPQIFEKQKSRIHWKSHLFITLTMATLIFSLPFLPQQAHDLNVINVQTIGILIMVGFILAGTLIIPGISGSLVLLVLGFYVYLFDTARLILERILTFDIGLIIEASIPLIFVGIGLVIGIIVFAFFLKWLLKKYQTYLYSGVLGLLIASPFSIILEADKTYPNVWDGLVWTIPLGIVLFGLGLYGGFILQEKD